ncbi:MAG: hypothetical protein E6G54_06535 [Actinobacteria bacterium]|nr:MAG: hypothetical protein E6G54_06535 [Actinomycetota bacterium]
MKRGLKLGFGIPLVLLGLFMTIAGIALVVLVGSDGSFTLPATPATSSGHALVLEALDLSGSLPSSGSFAATVGVTVQENDGAGDVFVGIGPAVDVARYLDRVQLDRIVQVNWRDRDVERVLVLLATRPRARRPHRVLRLRDARGGSGDDADRVPARGCPHVADRARLVRDRGRRAATAGRTRRGI